MVRSNEGILVYCDGEAVWGLADQDEARYLVLRETIEALCGASNVAAVFHAGCVARDGSCILIAGGTGKGIELSERDRWICEQVGPSLRERGLMFVGLDVIGDYLTEINVTSPTCIRELEKIYNIDIAGKLMDCIEVSVHSQK